MNSDEADLLRRALSMLIRLGDFIGNGDVGPGSIGTRCDLIRDIRAKLGEVPERHCLRCKKDLTDVMGCYVFVRRTGIDSRLVDGLLCVEHGANGANTLSQSQYDYLTKTPNQRRLHLLGEGDD